MKKRYFFIALAAGFVIGALAVILFNAFSPEPEAGTVSPKPGTAPKLITVKLESVGRGEVTYGGETYKITKKAELEYLTELFSGTHWLYAIVENERLAQPETTVTFYHSDGDRMHAFSVTWIDHDLSVYHDGIWYKIGNVSETDFAFWLRHRRAVDESLEN